MARRSPGVGEPVAAAEAGRSRSAFAVLRHRDFRLLFVGMLIGNLAMPMGWVAQSWLLIELVSRDHVALWLGAIGFVRGLPLLLFSLYGGALADRMDRRRLLLLAQLASLVVMLALAALAAGDWVTPWALLALSFAASAAQAFDQPARQALGPDLVEPTEVAAVATLTTMAQTSAVAVGPALSGLLVGWVGLSETFFLISFTYVATVVALLLMRSDGRRTVRTRRSLTADIREGVRYVRREPVALWIVSCTFAVTMLGMAFTNLVPAFVRDDLGGNAQGLGIFFGFWGAGALAATLALALGLRDLRRKGLTLLLTFFIFGVGLVAVSRAGALLPAVLLLLIPSSANTISLVLGTAAILSIAPPTMRGRVMGVFFMNRGLTPAGSVFAGGLGAWLGMRDAIAALALLSLAAVAMLTLAQPRAWRRVDAAIRSGQGTGTGTRMDADRDGLPRRQVTNDAGSP